MSRRTADTPIDTVRRPQRRVGVFWGASVRRWAVVAAASFWVAGGANALSLGALVVRSVQGEPLVADIALDAISSAEQSSLQARIASPDAFRAAGLAFEPALRGAQLVLTQNAQGKAVLRLTGQVPAQVPFVDLIVEAGWASGRLVREFTLLLPAAPSGSSLGQGASVPPAPPLAVSPPVVESAPTLTPVPVVEEAAAVPAAASNPGTPSAEVPSAAVTPNPPAQEAPTSTAAAAPTRTAVQPDVQAEVSARRSYVVRPGDTLARIAREHAVKGAQPEQQWVGILRGNPQAFAKGNVHRLLSGRSLNLPSEDDVRAVDEAEAKALVAEQRQAFDADRRRLAAQATAGTVSANVPDKAQRSQGVVRDAKAAVTPPTTPPATPDRLELSKSSATPAQVQEDRKAAEALALKAAQAREAELRRNLEALQQLQAERAQSAKANAANAAAASSSTPAVVAELTPAPAAPASTSTSAEAPAVAPEVAAKAPPETSPPSASNSESSPPAVPSAPAAADTPPDSSPEADRMQNWLNSTWALPLASILALLVLAAGAWGLWRRRRGGGADSVTSPDAALADELGSPSEQDMLGELGALSDVDPVAEADVYLAYGRDRQAEEILREALAADTSNLRYHGKLLEILALRRDTETFISQAQVVADLTGREGRDWAQVAVFGRQLAPDLPLFQTSSEPWMEPEEDLVDLTSSAAPMPATNPVPALARDSEFPAGLSDFGDDTPLTLNGHSPADGSASSSAAIAEPPVAPSASADQDWPEASSGPDVDLGMDALPSGPDDSDGSGATAIEPLPSEGSDSDEDALDDAQNDSAIQAAPSPFPGGVDPFEGLSLDLDVPEDEPAEPNASVMARKLSLAEEFVQLGDQEGAAELLREVVMQAEDEAQRAQAQERLDRLS